MSKHYRNRIVTNGHHTPGANGKAPEPAPAPEPSPEAQEAAAQNEALLLRQRRAEQCSLEVNAILEKYRCAFDVVLVLRGGQLPTSQVNVVARE